MSGLYGILNPTKPNDLGIVGMWECFQEAVITVSLRARRPPQRTARLGPLSQRTHDTIKESNNT